MRSASRTVLRPTPRDSTSSASVGSLSPGPKPPFVSFPKASGLSFHPGSVFPCIFPLLYTHNLISCRLGQTIHNRLPQMVFPKAFRKNKLLPSDHQIPAVLRTGYERPIPGFFLLQCCGQCPPVGSSGLIRTDNSHPHSGVNLLLCQFPYHGTMRSTCS